MSLGTALLRPQALADPPAAPRVDAVDAARDLVLGLARDLASGGAGWAIIERELTAGVEQLLAAIEPNVDWAKTSVSALIDPVVGTVRDAIGSVAGDASPEEIVSAGAKLLRAVATALQSLQPAQLSDLLGRIFDILEDDLGLSQAKVAQCFSGIADRIVTGLQHDLVAGSADPGAADRYALGAAIQEVLATAASGIPLPALSKETIIPPIVNAMSGSGVPTQLADLGAKLGRVADALEPIGSLAALAESLAEPGPPHDVPGSRARTPGAPLPKAGTDTFWYATWYSGHVVTGTGDPASAPELNGVKFGTTLDAKTMEAIAHHSRWVAALLEAGLHGMSIERGDIAANMLNIVWRSTEGALAGLPFTDYEMPAWMRWVLGSGLTLAGGLEGGRWDDIFGLTLMLADVGEAQLYARWVWLLREAVLSGMTLANGNPDRIEGFAHMFGEVGSFMVPGILAMADPGNYGVPDGGGSWPRVLLYALLLAPVVTLAFTFIGGAVFGRMLAGSVDAGKVARLALKERMFGGFHGGSAGNVALAVWTLLGSIVSYPLDFSVYWFLLNESKTNGGKLSGRDANGNEIKAPGYPSDAEHSPYKLPWASGNTVQCAQGNHGIWSHTPFSFRCQLYAFDFGVDHGTEALAMRDGVVWDFREGTKDGDSDNQENAIIILHDDPPAAGYDVDQNGVAARTFAEYLHGRKNGITDAFGGTAPVRERDSPGSGTRVVQGQRVMFTDDTGRSAYNHLHVHVRPMKADGTPDDYTVPMVFSDDQVRGDGGVPQSMNWYDSSNSKPP
jgi:hypothetical protein